MQVAFFPVVTNSTSRSKVLSCRHLYLHFLPRRLPRVWLIPEHQSTLNISTQHIATELALETNTQSTVTQENWHWILQNTVIALHNILNLNIILQTIIIINMIELTDDFVRCIAGERKACCFWVNFHCPPQSLLGSVRHTEGNLVTTITYRNTRQPHHVFIITCLLRLIWWSCAVPVATSPSGEQMLWSCSARHQYLCHSTHSTPKLRLWKTLRGVPSPSKGCSSSYQFLVGPLMTSLWCNIIHRLVYTYTCSVLTYSNNDIGYVSVFCKHLERERE